MESTEFDDREEVRREFVAYFKRSREYTPACQFHQRAPAPKTYEYLRNPSSTVLGRLSVYYPILGTVCLVGFAPWTNVAEMGIQRSGTKEALQELYATFTLGLQRHRLFFALVCWLATNSTQ